MKRSLEEGTPIVLSLVEALPDDVLMEILLFTFHNVAIDAKVMREVINARETSVRLREMIDRYILSVVTELSDNDVLMAMEDDDLALFTGLQVLIVSRAQYNYIDGKKLTRLSRLTDTGLGHVASHLKSLEVHGVIFTDVGISTLSNLESLVIAKNDVISDKGLDGLSQLRRLKISRKSKLDGSCFNHLASLESLHLYHNKSIETEALLFLSHNLRRLTIEGKTLLSYHKGLATMTTLESLTISNPKEDNRPHFDDQCLLALPGLTDLKLYGVRTITNKGLANLTGLRVLDVQYETQITFSDSLPFGTTLEELWINQAFTPVPEECLAFFQNLREVHIFTYTATNAMLLVKWEDATQKRGLELDVYGFDVD